MSTEEEDDYVPYSQRDEWKDITPTYFSSDESAVVNIAYTEKFSEVYGYFRSILRKDERSERAFDLSTDAVHENPANYTAWHFRRILLKSLNKNLDTELKYCSEVIQYNPKNYQVWYHRKLLVEWLNNASAEKGFTCQILRDDSKNYHAWQHRQWFVQHFKMWDGELDFTALLIAEDARNNSAWNYRYFVINNTTGFTPEVVDSEIRATLELISKMPHNESPWTYLTGLAINEGLTAYPLTWAFAEDQYNSTDPLKRSPYLLVFMYDYLVEKMTKLKSSGDGSRSIADELGMRERAQNLCDELVEVDPIRRKYWVYLKNCIVDIEFYNNR